MRIRFTYFLLLVIVLTACDRKIVLRLDPVETVPFSQEIEKGKYELTFYKLNYPEVLLEKEIFYRDLNILVKKLYVKDKKRDVIISEKFYKDFILISEGNLLKEEQVFEKVASNLTLNEKLKIKEITNKSISKFSNTVQEYLNLQVFHLLKIIDRSDEFELDKIYTEREKNNLILEIKNQRKQIAEVIEQMELSMTINITAPYEEQQEIGYWDDIDIELDKTAGSIRADLATYELPLFVENLKISDINEVLIGNQIFLNDVVILKNDVYTGYIYDTTKKKFTFFTGGDQERSRFSSYEIYINIKEIEFADLISLDEKYILTDFIGGKK